MPEKETAKQKPSEKATVTPDGAKDVPHHASLPTGSSKEMPVPSLPTNGPQTAKPIPVGKPMLRLKLLISISVVLGCSVGIWLMLRKPDPAKPADELAFASAGTKSEEPIPEHEDDEPVPALIQDMPQEKVYDSLMRGTVLVYIFGNESQKQYLGWVYDAIRQLIVTNATVAKTSNRISVLFPKFLPNGELDADFKSYVNDKESKELFFDAEIVSSDDSTNTQLAILKLLPRDKQKAPSFLKPLSLANKTPKATTPVMSPDTSALSRDLFWKPTKGNIQGIVNGNKILEIDQKLDAINCGGAVVNYRGELVGTLLKCNSDQASCTAVDVEEVRAFLKKAYTSKGWKWVEQATTTYEPKDKIAILLKRVRVAHEKKNRVLVLKSLREIGTLGPDARPAIVELFSFLLGEDAEIRATTLEVLRRVGGESDYDQARLTEAIQSKRLEPQLYAALAYTKMSAPAEAMERLREFLVAKQEGDGNYAELRIAALKAIANNKLDSANNNSIIATVLQLLDDNAGSVADEASHTLEVILYPLTLKKLEPLVVAVIRTEEDWIKEAATRPAHLSGSSENGRMRAAQILKRIVINKENREGLLSYEWTRGLFFPLLKKSDPRLQAIAIEALRVWKRAAVECVRPAIKPYRWLVDSEYKWKDEHYQGFLDLASYSKTQAVRLEAVKAIGDMGSRKGGRLRRLADIVFSEIIEVDVVEILDQIAATDPDDNVQSAAVEAMMSLIRVEPRTSDLAILVKWFAKDNFATLRGSNSPLLTGAQPLVDGQHDLRATVAELLGDVIRLTKRTTPLAVPKMAVEVAPLLIEALRQNTLLGVANNDLRLYALNALNELGPQIKDPKVVALKVANDATQVAIESLIPERTMPTVGNTVADKDIAGKLLRFTVWIHTDNSNGSGSVITGGDTPLVITNHHVIRDAKTIHVIFPVIGENKEVNGTQKYYLDNMVSLRKSRQFQNATVVIDKPSKDLAILKLTSPLPDGAFPVRRASGGAKTGQTLFSRGMSGVNDGSLWRYSDGKCRAVIANSNFSYRTGQDVSASVIEHTCQINPGDSGSGIINEAGELVAVNCASDAKSNNVNIAIDLSEVDKLLANIRNNNLTGNPRQGELANNAKANSGNVQNAAIELLRTLGTPAIRPLTAALSKNPGVEQVQRICQLLKEYARLDDAKVRTELLATAPLYLCRIGSESDNDDIREATSSTIAEIGGMEVVEPLKNLTMFTTLPGPKPRQAARSWAVKTLGRLDPDKLIEMKEGKPVSKAKSVIEFMRDIPKAEKDKDINRLAADAQQNLTRSGVK